MMSTNSHVQISPFEGRNVLILSLWCSAYMIKLGKGAPDIYTIYSTIFYSNLLDKL